MLLPALVLALAVCVSGEKQGEFGGRRSKTRPDGNQEVVGMDVPFTAEKAMMSAIKLVTNLTMANFPIVGPEIPTWFSSNACMLY